MSLLTSNSYRWPGQNETKYDKLHWPSDARKRKQNLAKIHQFMNLNNAGGFMSNKYTTTLCYNNGTKSLKKMLKVFNIGHRSEHYLPLSLSQFSLETAFSKWDHQRRMYYCKPSIFHLKLLMDHGRLGGRQSKTKMCGGLSQCFLDHLTVKIMTAIS